MKLTKPNLLRLIVFPLCFAGALYYPVREVIAYNDSWRKTPPEEYRFRIAGARLNDAKPRPQVSGRWKWIDYIYPRAEKANKLRLDLTAPQDPKAPKLHYVNYPMSRELAEQTLLTLKDPAKKAGAVLVIKCYPNGRWRIGSLFIGGKAVSEQRTASAE